MLLAFMPNNINSIIYIKKIKDPDQWSFNNQFLLNYHIIINHTIVNVLGISQYKYGNILNEVQVSLRFDSIERVIDQCDPISDELLKHFDLSEISKYSNIVTMISKIVLLCVLIYFLCINGNEAKPSAISGGYETRYDNIDLNELLKNDRLRKNYVKCLLNEGPCTPDAQELKSNRKIHIHIW